jgi:hypothetical protein
VNQLVLISAQTPALVRSASERAQTRSLGFFVANNHAYTARAPMAAHFAVMVALLLARAGARRCTLRPSPTTEAAASSFSISRIEPIRIGPSYESCLRNAGLLGRRLDAT